MRYAARPIPFQYSTSTSAVAVLGNLPTGKAAMLQQLSSDPAVMAMMQRMSALIPPTEGGGGATPNNTATTLCQCYVRQLSDTARRRGATLSPDDTSAFQAVCEGDPARFKVEAAERLSIALQDVCTGDGRNRGGGGDEEEKDNTWLWVAGGVAALGAFYLLRK